MGGYEYALMTVKKSVGKSVGKILELLSEFPEITRESLAAEVGLSVRGVEKNLAQLKSAGRIRRIGGRKGGHWEINRDGHAEDAEESRRERET
jgi:ATP-dependent DNA helicase RecG